MKIDKTLKRTFRRAQKFPVLGGKLPMVVKRAKKVPLLKAVWPLLVSPSAAKKPKKNSDREVPFSAYRYDKLSSEGPASLGKKRPIGGKLERVALFEGRYVFPRFGYHVDYRPPGPGVVFASVVNDKYAPGLEATVLSLRRVYPGLDNRYLVFHDESLSEFSRARLKRIYPHFEFRKEDPDFFAVPMGQALNHRRVGRLGYLTLHCIRIEEPEHLVILDSDLLILGDMSPLWQGDLVKAVSDIGHRPYGVVSKTAGRPVINSGVLSLPRSARGAAAWERAQRVLKTVYEDEDVDIERFADQRFWNIFFRNQEIELLPQSFNAIKSLSTRRYPDELPNVSILHVTGAKPWYSYLHASLLSEEDKERYEEARVEFKEIFTLWYNEHHRELLRSRLLDFRREMGPKLDAMKAVALDRPAVMIGNGPSIKKTDLGRFAGFEKFAFNWFVNHEDFDTVRPEHLIVASHMLFGGWSTPNPELPRAYLEALLSHEHKPVLWFSFYFKDYIETLEELRDYDVRYIFFEKPFKRRVSQYGRAQLDVYSPLMDCNTGVLTAGVPLAVHMGCPTIVLVGCDSNYASSAGSYFYAAEAHASPTTRESSLLKTWEAGGEGQYGYEVTRRALAERGIPFLDATLNGSLQNLDRLRLEDAPSLLGDR